MVNSVSVTYNRRVTNKSADGSFESVELGGGAEVVIDSVDTPEDAANAWEALYEEFSQKVETNLAAAVSGMTRTVPAEIQAVPVTADEKLTKWVKKSVDEQTAAIQGRMLPGEKISAKSKFANAPLDEDDESPSVDTIVENVAVSFKGVKVFYDNKSTKIGRGSNGSEYGFLRLGKKGEIPGGYVTGKSFDGEVVALIKEVIDVKPDYIDVYGYFKPRSDVEGVWDLMLQGLEPAD